MEGIHPIPLQSQTHPNLETGKTVDNPVIILSQNSDTDPQVPQNATPNPQPLRKAQEGKKEWKPPVVPELEVDAEALGLATSANKWPPHPSVEDVPDNRDTYGPSTASSPEPNTQERANFATKDVKDIPIPLRGIWDYYYKHIPSKPTPNPLQTLGWNANGQLDEYANKGTEAIEAKETLREVGKDTQESLDAIDEITGKMRKRREKMKKEEEKRANKIQKELEELVRKQKEGIR